MLEASSNNKGGLIGSSISPQPDLSWSKILRTLTFWALFVIGTIALVQYATESRRNYLEISYNQFVQELEQGNITTIQVTNRRVRGDLKRPMRLGERSSNHFVTSLPFESSVAWVTALVEKGVEVRGEEPTRRRPWPVVVLTFLPYVLILLLVIVMLRQLQARRKGNEP